VRIIAVCPFDASAIAVLAFNHLIP
jgi:hypothetical protein